MRGFKAYDAAHRFCREHGELQDLLRSRLPAPLPVRNRRPHWAWDHAEHVAQQAPVEEHSETGSKC